MYRIIAILLILAISVLSRDRIDRLDSLSVAMPQSSWGNIVNDFIGYYEIRIKFVTVSAEITLHVVRKNVSVDIVRDTVYFEGATSKNNNNAYVANSEIGIVYIKNGDLFCSLVHEGNMISTKLTRNFWKKRNKRKKRLLEWEDVLDKKVNTSDQKEETGYGYYPKVR